MTKIEKIKNQEAARVLLITADLILRNAFEKMSDSGFPLNKKDRELLDILGNIIFENSRNKT